jgi:phosphate transport system permease protein
MALGASKSRAIFTVVIPAAINGIITGTMLNVARVAGETAPLLFTSLGNRYWSHGLDQPTAALPVMIFDYARAPYDDWHKQAWAAAFVLLSLVLAINIFARVVLGKKTLAR